MTSSTARIYVCRYGDADCRRTAKQSWTRVAAEVDTEMCECPSNRDANI